MQRHPFGVVLAVIALGLLSACHSSTDASQDAKQTAGDQAVMHREPVKNDPPKQFSPDH